MVWDYVIMMISFLGEMLMLMMWLYLLTPKSVYVSPGLDTLLLLK